MMTKLSAETLKKVFSSEIKMAALNQERCTLATDDTIKKLRNAAKKHQQKHVVLVKCVEDMVRRKEYSFGNGRTRTG